MSTEHRPRDGMDKSSTGMNITCSDSPGWATLTTFEGDQFTRDGDIVTIHYWVHDGRTWTEPGKAEWTDARRPGETGKVRLLPGTDPEFEDYVISDIERVRALQREIQNAVGR